MYDGTRIQDNDIYNISSKRRNPILADIFNRLHYMDRRGSGFKKIVEYYEFQRNYNEELKPIFFSNNNDFYIVLKNLNYNNESMTLIECDTQNDTQNDTRSDIQNKKTIELIKELIKKNRNISRKEMAQLIGKSLSTLQRILNENENIKYEGSSKNGYWIIIQNDTQNDTQNGTQNKETLELIIKLITKDKNISRKKLAKLTGKSISTIQRIINNYGKIKYEGSSKKGHWVIED